MAEMVEELTRRLLLLAPEGKSYSKLCAGLASAGLDCQVVTSEKELVEEISREVPELVLVEIKGQLPDSVTWQTIRRLAPGGNLPVMALISKDVIADINVNFDADDFIILPGDSKELALRINRLTGKKAKPAALEPTHYGGLVIDTSSCEVILEGKILDLTFKEYELVKLLAGSRGRVCTRQVLLDKIWGYDYYGGDRTVDVHVRRLRSKIEDARHTYIDTVRNVGYRFKKDAAVKFVT
jgi:two-component system alkaline phosphatase synthesis response regulator PhoP